MSERVHPEPGPQPGPERLSRPPERVARDHSTAENPTWAADLTIKAKHASLEAHGHSSVTAAVGIVGVFGAVLTSYIASQAPHGAWPWFLGLAAAELAVVALTIISITKAGRRRGR